jgi:hypothetical protein
VFTSDWLGWEVSHAVPKKIGTRRKRELWVPPANVTLPTDVASPVTLYSATTTDDCDASVEVGRLALKMHPVVRCGGATHISPRAGASAVEVGGSVTIDASS